MVDEVRRQLRGDFAQSWCLEGWVANVLSSACFYRLIARHCLLSDTHTISTRIYIGVKVAFAGLLILYWMG